jgi:predicted CoA-binding protein
MVSGERVLLIDWPSLDVPESLARSGYDVVAQEGPSTYAAYEAEGSLVTRREVDEPLDADIVYAYRPLHELPDIVELASRLGARSVWWETGPDTASPDDLERAREIVTSAGLAFSDGRPAGSSA